MIKIWYIIMNQDILCYHILPKLYEVERQRFIFVCKHYASWMKNFRKHDPYSKNSIKALRGDSGPNYIKIGISGGDIAKHMMLAQKEIKTGRKVSDHHQGQIFIGLCIGGHAELCRMLIDHPISLRYMEYIAYIDDPDLLKLYLSRLLVVDTDQKHLKACIIPRLMPIATIAGSHKILDYMYGTYIVTASYSVRAMILCMYTLDHAKYILREYPVDALTCITSYLCDRPKYDILNYLYDNNYLSSFHIAKLFSSIQPKMKSWMKHRARTI